MAGLAAAAPSAPSPDPGARQISHAAQQGGTSAASAPALPDGAGEGWLARARRELAEREYWASQSRRGLQAPNRAQNLRTYFEPSGIRVHDRTAAGSPELLSLELAAIGRGEDLSPVAPGDLASEGARVEIRRPGLVEWYENSPAGLEQGFTLAERPKGEGLLALELTVERARASLSGEGAVLATPTGRRLAYTRLAALDAAGRELTARLEVPDAGRLRIVLDDGDARYPVTIDPLLKETADAQLESNQEDAYLGSSVAGAGDVNGDGYADVIVGAPHYDLGQGNEGAAFVFRGSASTIKDCSSARCGPRKAKARLESDQAGAGLGFSVAGAGDVNGDGYADVIVGAPSYDTGKANDACTAPGVPYSHCCTGVRRGTCKDEGAAFVFLGSDSGIANADCDFPPPRIRRAATPRQRPRSSSRARRTRSWAGAWRGPETSTATATPT
jgi:hypothetical protein